MLLSMQRGAKVVMCGTSHLVTSSANTRLMCTSCLAVCIRPWSRDTWSYNCRWDSFYCLSVKCHAWRGLTCRYASFFSLSSLSFHCSIFSFSVRNWNKHKNIKITQTGRTRTHLRLADVVHTPSDSRITSFRGSRNLQFRNSFNSRNCNNYKYGITCTYTHNGEHTQCTQNAVSDHAALWLDEMRSFQ